MSLTIREIVQCVLHIVRVFELLFVETTRCNNATEKLGDRHGDMRRMLEIMEGVVAIHGSDDLRAEFFEV
jgi:hypothetical protein